MEAVLAGHRRVVSEYEQRLSRLTASYAAARDSAASVRAAAAAQREEMERLGGELLEVGNLALAECLIYGGLGRWWIQTVFAKPLPHAT
jgi:hypothetical protein